MKKILLLLAIVSLLIPISVNAEGTLLFQAKCAEGAKQFVYGHSNVANYISHYNKKLDKCFALLIFGLSPDKYGRTRPDYLWRLYNVLEGTLIGEGDFVKEVCYVGEKECKSPEEFEVLLKPYMEE